MRIRIFNLGLVAFLATCVGRAQDVGGAPYLRARISAMYPVACEALPETDIPGRRAQKAAREALASYAKALAEIRHRQVLAAQGFTADQMDPDEKKARLESLGKQIQELELLTRPNGACPASFHLSVPQEDKVGAERLTPGLSSLAILEPHPDELRGSSSLHQEKSATVIAETGSDVDQQEASKQEQEAKLETNQTIPFASKLAQNQSETIKSTTPLIGVTEQGGPEPKLKVFPTELTFGRQPWQTESEPQTITVTNRSEKEVTLVSPLISSADFRIRNNTCTNILEKLGTCTFQVVYVPFSSRTPKSFVAALTSMDQAEFKALAGDLASKWGAAEAAAKAAQDAEEDLQRTKEVAEKAKKGKDFDKFRTFQEDVKNAEVRFQNRRDDLKYKESAAEKAWETLSAKPVIGLSGTPEHWKYPFMRSVAGLDASAASSRTVQQKFFIEADLMAPFHFPGLGKWKNEEPLENRWWFWVNPRITSLPQATNFSALSTLNESGAFFQNLRTQGTVADIAQGFDASAGLEFVLLKPRSGIPWWDEFPNTRARLSASFIFGGGASTPFSTDKTDITSKVNQSICDAFNNARTTSFTCKFPSGATSPVIQVDSTNKPFITFVTPDRSRFFRRFFAGFRLKSYYFSKDVKADCYPPTPRPEARGDCEAPYNIFPGIMDVTIGQDESITSGLLRGLVFRGEASYPLSFFPGVHLYTSVYTLLRKNRPSPPFSSFLVQAPDAGSNNDANTFRFPVPPLSRDYFRIGIGVDILQVIKKFEKGGGQPTTHAPSPTSPPVVPAAASVAPSVATQPEDQTVTAGHTVTFSVVAAGTAPLSYQWQKNGANIAGATASTYTTPATTTADNGAQFTVVVSNTAGSVTSDPAALTVNK